MILQIVVANSIMRHKRLARPSPDGRTERKRTPVRVVFGDPKRNCEGYGLCKLDLGEDDYGLDCPNLKVEYGVILSDTRTDVHYLVISRTGYERNLRAGHSLSTPQFLNVPLSLAREIGLSGTRLLVEGPQLAEVA